MVEMMSTDEIRASFIRYFREHGHEEVTSSSLVPAHDPTLLFTNAGMVQFKDTFLGREHRANDKAVSSQRCVRAGGKHNDLENVGYTARHHTFFEMLGNFSFGGYFKREAIRHAWTLLTEVYQLPPERLWVTVYQTDQEAEAIWLNEIGVSPTRLSRCGDADNFWSMGDVGPCGPCSEIFYDHGSAVSGGPPGSPDAEGDRYIEIWNLVFMQYDRSADGTLTPIPKPSVDTGMGLERIAAVLQGVHSNYDIDLFRTIKSGIAALLGAPVPDSPSLNVVADHLRSTSFLIADGVLPGNEGRGYVLRRIIRRAVRHGQKLGFSGAFLHRLVPTLVEAMGTAYPMLTDHSGTIAAALLQEEERFGETLHQGLRLLDAAIARSEHGRVSGFDVFQLYDTYGFPVDLTADIARERGLTIDHEGFEQEMERQRQRARAASHFSAEASALPQGVEACTDFVGYAVAESRSAVIGLYANGAEVPVLSAGQSGVVLIEATPFYAESGGQVGDTGRLVGTSGVFEVTDTQRQAGAVVHVGAVVEGRLAAGELVTARIDNQRRERTRRNHSGTHLLHAALREVLGTHVQQKGSLVTPERLRFDFAHPDPVTPEQLRQIEGRVNEQILLNEPVATELMSYPEALAAGAVALFGEKYGDTVRVLSMGEFSRELCGGTHVARTGDIGNLKIIAESGVGAGVRRIEAVTGAGALEWSWDTEDRLRAICQTLKASRDTVQLRLTTALDRLRDQEREIAALQGKLASQQGSDLSQQAEAIGPTRILVAEVNVADVNALRDLVDQLKNKLGSGAVLLASADAENKVRLIAGVTADMTKTLKAGDLVNVAAAEVGGKGGGRPDMAQAGGTDPTRIPAALAAGRNWLQQKLSV
jgi:alanyl-tRNA synthetase